MRPHQEQELPRLLCSASTHACLPVSTGHSAPGGHRAAEPTWKHMLATKPAMGLSTEASTRQPHVRARSFQQPHRGHVADRHRCHCQGLMGGTPEKQGVWANGEWTRQAQAGSRQVLMRQLALAATERPTRHRPLAHQKHPSQAPGTSTRQVPWEFPAASTFPA